MMCFDDTLERLALTFSVRDFMIAKDDLVCASSDDIARIELEKHPAFDVIPLIDKNGEISAYFERERNKRRSFRQGDIVSDSTSILSLVSILRSRKFCFVLAKDKIVGYIHFSDLNRGIVKLPYFLILEDLECRLVERIGHEIHEDNLQAVLDPERIKQVKDRMQRMKDTRSELRWVNLLYFKEIVEFAIYFKIVQLEAAQVEILAQIRNSICHADRPLIEKHEDLRSLDEAGHICLSLIESDACDGRLAHEA